MTEQAGAMGGPGWRLARWGLIGGLILLPWIAMQFTDEVVWTLGDFAFAGAVLGGAGLLYEVLALKVRSMGGRLAIGAMIAAAVMLLWAAAVSSVF